MGLLNHVAMCWAERVCATMVLFEEIGVEEGELMLEVSGSTGDRWKTVTVSEFPAS